VNPPRGGGGRSYLVNCSPADGSATPAPGLCAASSGDPTTGTDTTYPHAPTLTLRPTRNRRKSSPRLTTILEINNQPPDQQPTPRSTTNPEINNQPQKYPGRATPAQTHQHHSATLQNSTGSVARSGDNWFYPTAASSGGISWLRAHPIRPAVLCAPVVEASSSSAVTPNTACTPSTHARCFPARVNSRERTIGV